MSENLEQRDQSLYDPLNNAPANADELAVLIDEMTACQKYLSKHPKSRKSQEKFTALEDKMDAMFDEAEKNHEFIAEYLNTLDTDLFRTEALVKKWGAGEKESLNARFLSRNAGTMYSYLGDFYSGNKDEKLNSKAGGAYLKSLGHLKFSLDVSGRKDDYKLLQEYAWSVIRYFEHEDYGKIEKDNMLIELKMLILKYIADFEKKADCKDKADRKDTAERNDIADLYDDLARINVLLADYYNTKASPGGEDMRNLEDSDKRYISSLFDNAVRYSRSAILYSSPDDDSAEKTYVDVNIRYARCLFRFGDEKRANEMLRNLLKTYKDPEAKVEIARQLFVAYGANSKPVLEMIKQILFNVVESDPKIINAHYILGRIALAEHTFDLEETIGKIETAIKVILEIDPGDKDNLARDLSEGLTGLKSAMFAARVNRVFDHEGAN